MKKINIIILAVLAGVISIFCLNELFKALIALAFSQEVSAGFSGIIFNIHLIIKSSTGVLVDILILISPSIACIICIETSIIILAKAKGDHLRNFLIIYQLVSIGYLLVNIFVVIFLVIFQPSGHPVLTDFLLKENIPHSEQMIFLLLILIILTGYLNIVTKRIRKNIPVIK